MNSGIVIGRYKKVIVSNNIIINNIRNIIRNNIRLVCQSFLDNINFFSTGGWGEAENELVIRH
jgi:hypothetical protein